MASQYPPKKNAAFTLFFTLYKNDGTVVANPGTITKKVSIDGADVADISASVTEENTTYGQCSVVLSAAEMNGDAIWVYITDDTSGTVPFTATIYTTTRTLDELATQLGIVAYGTAQSAAATNIVLAAASSYANDELNGSVVVITGGTGIGQSRVITDYDSASDTATVDTWTTTPSGTITYVILAAPPASTTAMPAVTVGTGGITTSSFAAGAIDAAAIAADAITSSELAASAATEIAGAVWDLATSGHVSSGTFGEQLKTDVDAILADTGTDGVVIGADAITAAKIADDAFSSEHFADGAFTTATFAAGAIDAAALSDDAVDAILDEVVEGSTTLRQMLRGFASVLLSRVSGAGTSTVTFRDIDNTKNRVVASVDTSGNRSAVTLTLT